MADETRTDVEDSAATRAHALYRQSRDHTSEWRQEVRTTYNMVAGDQWDDADKQVLKNQNRVPVVFNRIQRTVNAVVGTQVANRQETRFIPREKGDVEVNEILTAAADWVRDGCDAEDEESDAFEDMLTCGMGWTETRLDYEDEPDGNIKIDRIDPLEMYWDPGATKRNLSDARWLMRVRVMGLSEFEEEWPGADVEQASAPWESVDDDVQQRIHVYPQDAYRWQQSQRTGTKGRPVIRVAQLQWAEKTTSYRVGKRAETIKAGAFEKLRPKLEERGISFIKQQGVTWRQAFVAGGVVLDEGKCPCPFGSTFRAMTYKRHRNKNLWYGLVQAMQDPQKWGNKFFSTILDILNKGAKGGVMIETDAVEDQRDFESKWSRPDSAMWLRSGALTQGKIQPKPVVELPAGLDRLMSFAMDGVHEVTGVNLELLGMADRAQAGVLEAQRKRAGLTIIAPLFDAMRRYRKEHGRVLLHFIQTYISDGRLIRIIGKDGGEQYAPLVKQDDVAAYDIIVDEAPTSPNMKERVYGALIEMMPTLAKMGVPLPPELLDYAPIPSSLAQKWKELIEESGGMDPEEVQQQVQQMQQQIQKLMQENQSLKDKREETAATLQMKQQEGQATLDLKAEENRAAIDLKREEAQAAHDLKIEELDRETELKRAQAEAEMALKKEAIEADIDLMRFKANAEIEIKRDLANARPNGQERPQ